VMDRSEKLRRRNERDRQRRAQETDKQREARSVQKKPIIMRPYVDYQDAGHLTELHVMPCPLKNKKLFNKYRRERRAARRPEQQVQRQSALSMTIGRLAIVHDITLQYVKILSTVRSI